MIEKHDMFTPLLAVCPSFAPEWRALTSHWQADVETSPASDPPLYLALNALARHLGKMLHDGQTAEFPEIFAAIERWHVEGDAYVRNAATIGLLEDLQNPVNLGDKMPSDIIPWLGEQSLVGWRDLERFWGIHFHDNAHMVIPAS